MAVDPKIQNEYNEAYWQAFTNSPLADSQMVDWNVGSAFQLKHEADASNEAGKAFHSTLTAKPNDNNFQVISIAQDQLNQIYKYRHENRNDNAYRYSEMVFWNVTNGDNLHQAIEHADSHWADKSSLSGAKKEFSTLMTAEKGLDGSKNPLLNFNEYGKQLQAQAQSEGFADPKEMTLSHAAGINSDQKHALDDWARKQTLGDDPNRKISDINDYAHTFGLVNFNSVYHGQSGNKPFIQSVLSGDVVDHHPPDINNISGSVASPASTATVTGGGNDLATMKREGFQSVQEMMMAHMLGVHNGASMPAINRIAVKHAGQFKQTDNENIDPKNIDSLGSLMEAAGVSVADPADVPRAQQWLTKTFAKADGVSNELAAIPKGTPAAPASTHVGTTLDHDKLERVQVAVGIAGDKRGKPGLETGKAIGDMIIMAQATDAYTKKPDGIYGEGTQAGFDELAAKGKITSEQANAFRDLAGNNHDYAGARQFLAAAGYVPPKDVAQQVAALRTQHEQAAHAPVQTAAESAEALRQTTLNIHNKLEQSNLLNLDSISSGSTNFALSTTTVPNVNLDLVPKAAVGKNWKAELAANRALEAEQGQNVDGRVKHTKYNGNDVTTVTDGNVQDSLVHDRKTGAEIAFHRLKIDGHWQLQSIVEAGSNGNVALAEQIDSSKNLVAQQIDPAVDPGADKKLTPPPKQSFQLASLSGGR